MSVLPCLLRLKTKHDRSCRLSQSHQTPSHRLPPRPHHTRSDCDKLTIPDNLKNNDGSIKDFPALRRYYAQLRAASVTSTKLKLVVIGWGEHGKSSLVLRLKELESPGAAPSPLPTRSDRTIGIEMTILQDTFVVHDFGAFQLLCNPPTRRAYEPLRPP